MSPLASSIRFLQTQPDARLVELARDGHERAFEALVHRYRRELLAYCRRLTSSEASAEDVLQQGLLQAWVAIGRDAEVREVRAWLYRIVHNVAISNVRRAGAEPVELDGTYGDGGADSEVERRLAARDALAGIAALPELQRRVMLSTALEGRSHQEIAVALGLTHGAVRGLIYRARAALRAAAAVVVPGPLVSWAARQEVRGGPGSSRVYEAVAGGGTAGVGGLLLKGGAIVATAGALATAAGLNPIHVTRHRHSHGQARALLAARSASSRSAVTAHATTVTPTSVVAGGPVRVASVGRGSQPVRIALASASGQHLSYHASSRSASGSGSGSGRASPSDGGDGSHGGSGSGEHSSPTGGSGGSGGHDGGGSGGTGGGTSGGHDGGSSGGGDGGTSGGGDGGTSGGGTTGTSSGSDGGSSGGSDGGSSGGGSGSSGGSGGGTTTTPTGDLTPSGGD